MIHRHHVVRWRYTIAGAVLAAVLAAGAAPTAGQSLLERSDNIHGGWVGQRGQLYFTFIHRFVASPEPTRKVTNFPTMTFAAALPARTLVGANYSTNSLLAPGYPNEWEFFARHRPFAVATGAPLDVSLQVGYNLAVEGVDGALSLGRELGRIHPLAAFRALSAPPGTDGGMQMALAGGAVVRLHRLVSVSGDVGRVLGEDDARLAWSAGVRLGIPYTPHTLSLHASNTNAATLQGASRGERTRWGFEFTIPLTVARWRAAITPPAPPPPPPAEVRVDTVVVVDTVTRIDTVLVRDALPVGRDTIAARRDTTRAANDTPSDAAAQAPAAREAPPPTAPPPTAPPPARTDTAAPPAARTDTAEAVRPAARPRPQQPPGPTVRTVEIENVAYAPARIEIARGTVVEWINRDPVQHSVTARDGSFDSGLIEPDARFRRTFDRAGTFEIYCRPHPFMSMTVVVR